MRRQIEIRVPDGLSGMQMLAVSCLAGPGGEVAVHVDSSIGTPQVTVRTGATPRAAEIADVVKAVNRVLAVK